MVFRSPEDEGGKLFDTTFPSAAELKELKEKERFQTVLTDILSKLREEDSSLVTYTGRIPDECIDFLKSKGYTVLTRAERIVSTNGRVKYIYDISY